MRESIEDATEALVQVYKVMIWNLLNKINYLLKNKYK